MRYWHDEGVEVLLLEVLKSSAGVTGATHTMFEVTAGRMRDTVSRRRSYPKNQRHFRPYKPIII